MSGHDIVWQAAEFEVMLRFFQEREQSGAQESREKTRRNGELAGEGAAKQENIEDSYKKVSYGSEGLQLRVYICWVRLVVDTEKWLKSQPTR